jgi:adenine-specific DNA methylase
MLLALLWPDPCDPNCPAEFKEKAREMLPSVQGKPGPTDEDLRKALLRFIGDFANWNLSADPNYLEVSRALVKAAHGDEPPLVVDPFAGGGSIPLEALRVGCEVFASDLNPVACLILRVLLEDIPRSGPALADELRRAGAQVKVAAEKELAEFYPVDSDGARPIAYLWARTVRCEAPNCGAEIPLMRSFWLCKKENRKRALRYRVGRDDAQTPGVEFEVFEPKTDKEVPNGTVTRAKATCLCCHAVLQPERVRAQLTEQKGGADTIFDANGSRIGGARLLAIVTLKPGEHGRYYRGAERTDYKAVWEAAQSLEVNYLSKATSLSAIPNETISLDEIRRVSVPLYGATSWGDIFTSRQKLVIATYSWAIKKVETTEMARRLLALALDRLVILSSAHCRWKPTGESVIDMFGRHAIGMVWDFCEPSPGFASASLYASWMQQFDGFIRFLSTLALKPADITPADAVATPLPDAACQVWFTDPPYYDSIPYSHLADCFYVWLKRVFFQTPNGKWFQNELTPKEGECVVDRPHSLSKSTKDEKYFEGKIALAAAEGRRLLSESGCASVVFAHKTTEGWEALLGGIIASGFTITCSWPIATELSSRLNARDTASLATSVHLVLRPRPEDAPVGDWGEALRELPKRVGHWMERLQSEGIRGADLVFACIGPALEIYSRYSKVVDPEEREIPLGGNPEADEPHKRGFLAYVWEIVGRTALQQVLGTSEAQARNGMAGALEEDARLTALFLWTLQGTNGEGERGKVADEEEDLDDEEEGGARTKPKGFTLIFDVARRFAQPLGIHLPEWEGRIIETKKGIVRLLPVMERAGQLFGEEGAEAVADRMEQSRAARVQDLLFPELEQQLAPRVRGRGRSGSVRNQIGDESLRTKREATTLDRVHAAMLLQAGGRSNALRALLKAEQERGSDFLRLANALSALYPRTSEEKRLLDAMLLAVPR